MEYLVVIERAEDGSFSAYVPDLPGCVSCGDSIEESLVEDEAEPHDLAVTVPAVPDQVTLSLDDSRPEHRPAFF